MNKREFVLGGCAATLAAMSPMSKAAASARRPAGSSDLNRLQAWRHRLGEQFALIPAGGVTLTLSEVRVGALSPGIEQFSLVFSSDAVQPSRPASCEIIGLVDGRHIALYLEPLALRQADHVPRYAAHFGTLI